MAVAALVFAYPALAVPGPQTEPSSQPVPVSPEDRAWGFDKTDLPPDPDVRFGVLPNGMRYAIRHNDTPQGTAVVRLIFDIGSVAESDAQRGIAHFIEHMAFNGTRHVPEGEMVKLLERYGLAFGADTNAYTSFDRTGYTLDLPNASPELIDTSLFLMREVASEILFDPVAIDRERGVILSEKRSRSTYRTKAFENRTRFILPDGNIANRLPIGTENVIRTAPAATFRDFYDRYYTPGRATLVIVGDVDPDSIAAKIAAGFGDWHGKYGESPDPDYGTIDPARRGRVNEFIDPAIGETATLVALAPYAANADTITERQANLKRGIGYAIIGRRIARAIRRGDEPFTGAGIDTDDIFKLARQSSLTVSAKDGELPAAIAAAEKIVRTALTYGFSDAEISEQIANYRRVQENAVKSAATRRNSVLADELVDAALERRIVTTPQSSMARFEIAIRGINAGTVLAALRADLIPLDDPLVQVTSKSGVNDGPESIRNAYLASRGKPVVSPDASDLSGFAYSDFGPPGQVVADSRIADLNIRTLAFANNVRLNIKHTDFEKDRVRITLRIDGGDLLDTRDAPYRTLLMGIFVSGGLEAHSIDDLQSILAGRSVSASFGDGTDYFGSYVGTTPEDSLLQMQLLTAYVTAPGYREEAVGRYRRSIPNYYARLYATPGSALSARVGGILSDDDPRFTQPLRSVYETEDFPALKSAISNRLAHGAIEIGIVGDIDEDDAIAIVARTFGALPQRESAFRDYDENRQRVFTADRTVRRIYHTGEVNQAILRLYWPTDDDSDADSTAARSMLADILQLRLTDRLREALGATYSPGASSFASSVYPGYGYISVGSNVDYADLDTVNAAIMEIVRDLRETPPDCDEMARARNPVLEKIRKARRENGNWSAIVDEAQSEPDRLDRFRGAEDRYRAVTADEIRLTAREYLAPGTALRIESVHESREEALARP